MGWHLKKEVSVGHIVTTLLLLGAVVGYANQLSARVSVLETKDQGFNASLLRIERAIERVEDKLDRKQDKE